MSSVSETDSEGESLGVILPPLIDDLRNVLDEYPDDGQILKELIQNAEDAGATTVKILTDTRTFHQEVESKLLRKHPLLKFFKGPALCVYNDAQFTERDWEGIRMLRASVKEKDPLKVGRFGLGFKSVFHLTDRLVVFSGKTLMCMDPFKPGEDYCKSKTVGGTQRKKRKELETLLKCLEGVFGATKETFSAGSGGFPGTLFWFPLRQKGSELSSTVYTQHKVHNLLTAFKAEAPSMLLFLNNIQHVTIYTRDDTCGPGEIFSVGLASSCLEAVTRERSNFVAAIREAAEAAKETQEAGQGLPEEGCYCLTEVSIETIDHFPMQQFGTANNGPAPNSTEEDFTEENRNTGSDNAKGSIVNSSSEIQSWLVATYHAGKTELSEELIKLCADPELNYRPYVGVAVPLTSHQEFQSQVFCFLPLPLDTRSPTGLPVHVHGYFALSQNRRHLKWPTADQLSLGGQLDAPLQWNCLLVRELLPVVYGALLNRLKNGDTPNPQQFFAALPDLCKVDDRWSSLLRLLYTDVCKKPSFHSHSQSSEWVSLQECVLEELSESLMDKLGQEQNDIKATVAKIYAVSGEKLVQLPDYVRNTLQELNLLQSAKVMTADRVRDLLPASLPHLSHADRLHVLQFLCCHEDALDLVKNQELLPLADETFAQIKDCEDGSPMICRCTSDLLQLFLGLEYLFCQNNLPSAIEECLHKLVLSGKFNLRKLEDTDAEIPELIKKSLQARFGNEQPSLPCDNAWIQLIWDFLGTKELRLFSHLTLLPQNRDERLILLPLSGVYVCSSVRGMTPLTPDLTSCLTKFGVTVVPELPDYVTRHQNMMGHWVHFPSPEGMLSALKLINDDATQRESATERFNTTATVGEKVAVMTLLVEASGENQSPLEMFLHLKMFTEVNTSEPVSVDQVSVIAPDILPPVTSQRRILSCSDLQRRAAVTLGASETTLKEVINETIVLMHPGCTHFSSTQITAFMKFIIDDSSLVSDTVIADQMKQIECVPTQSGQVRFVTELYDPDSEVLQKLFLAEDRFPSSEFSESNILKTLRSLGLRSEAEIRSADIIASAERIEQLLDDRDECAAVKKADGLEQILIHHGQGLDGNTLRQLSSLRCLPCQEEKDRPGFYPASLPFSHSCRLARPKEMCSGDQVGIVGSVLPVLRGNLPTDVAQHLQIGNLANPEHVLQHLDNILSCYKRHEAPQYRLALKNVFDFLVENIENIMVLEALKIKSSILTETGDCFAKPNSFWMEESPNDISLQPYRFLLPSDLQDKKDLFERCGAVSKQDARMLQEVLGEIQNVHEQETRTPHEFDRDFQLVKRILDVLKKSGSDFDGTVLLPVCHSSQHVLRFQQAKHCTIVSPDGLSSLSSFDADEEIVIVHNEIHQDTAEALGALKMKDRALTGVEDLDFGYEQREELTTRLHNLLEESYTDGFSVPKELIQNADDAGATEVCFLLDERENKDARKNLITENMDSLQGPALWAYNDATFSDEDFENIIRFGAGTKKEDASKVGRFGLGFNSVYNLTDVPSFISRHTLAMFDPHVKYLKRGAGLKLDFTHPVNRALLSRMSQQFKPYQGVFGCQLKNDGDVYYEGTLFRFPFRTSEQATDSKIKQDKYGRSKRQEFLKMLLERAGSLLLFTQSVKRVKVFYLPRDCTDPSSPKSILDLTKTSLAQVLQPETQIGDQTILQYFTSQWSTNTKIQIVEDVKINLTVTEDAEVVCNTEAHGSNTHWRLAWASGVDQSATLARENVQEGLVPLATVAALVDETGIKAIHDSPPGFYKTGHLFCFLPLPETMALHDLLVHVNGTFALSSSRRSLLESTEDDLNNKGAAWNSALITDAVSRAYLLLLENMKSEAAMDNDFRQFFSLWPVSGEEQLVTSFYKCLLSDKDSLLPVPGKDLWITLSDTWLLEPTFRQSKCGDAAAQALQHFWNRDGYLVDLPISICSLVLESGQVRVITQLEFFKEVFFPNIVDGFFRNEQRDAFVLFALAQKNSGIDELIKQYPCIPCTTPEELSAWQNHSQCGSDVAQNDKEHKGSDCSTSNSLQFAEDLYCPDSTILQQLFQSEKKFPCGEFSKPHLLEILMTFGLKKEATVKPVDVVAAAGLIQDILTQNNVQLAETKAEGLWQLLISEGDILDTDTLRQISAIQCLPCQQSADKPDHYPKTLPFNSTGNLASPQDMCHASQSQLVGSVLPTIRKGASETVERGLQVGNKVNLTRILQHLSNVVKHYDKHEIVQYKLVLTDVFGFLQKHMSESEVVQTLQEKECVLTESGDQFAKASAFWIEKCKDDIDLKPYRYALPSEMSEKEQLFVACGAYQRQDAQMLREVLAEIQEMHRQKSPDQSEYHRDMMLVKQILDNLKQSQTDGCVLLPISHSEVHVLKFQPAKACTVMSEEDIFSIGNSDLDEEIFIVHTEINHSTAFDLGALKMKDRALTGVEDLDFGYEQREELTTRLHNLLEESYTDGFSVPKELIQNADDAGATEVCFLVDERENEDARKNLITENMDSLQGPALWAYNDATFSDEDFENIIKFGAGTKKEDASKVGRFGLGFNSVYNLTDVPSFISRHTMAMFDPHVKYLKRGAGLKLDFTRQVNRALLSKMSQQFKPYQGVFGCQLKNSDDMFYDGTLFRFPFRTSEQATDSKIKQDSYGRSKRQEFLKMLLERAGSLLLFTQSVKRVKVFYLPRDCTDPSSPKSILDLTKTSLAQVLQPEAQIEDQTILQYFTSQWSTNNKIQIVENVTINMTVTNKASSVCDTEAHISSTHWRLAWASGVEQSATLARENVQEGLVPLATVAALVDETGIKAIHDSPPGFYKTGHLFCFLPLPETMALHDLLVHVNGTFALSSSRRSLLESTEDDLNNKGAAWNSALIADAVSRAYLLLLENMKSEAAMDNDFSDFFTLWPVTGDLVQNFYSVLMTNENKVLPVPVTNSWIAFRDAWFLDPSLRGGQCGDTAFKAAQHFWKKDGYIVDVPSDVCSFILESGQARVISQLQFFEEVFFPNIADEFFQNKDRDELVLYALAHQDSGVNKLIRQYPCIPCVCPDQLRLQQQEIQVERSDSVQKQKATKWISSDNHELAENLYSPGSATLQELFLAEKKFPCGEFAKSNILDSLKDFGLKFENTVKPEDVIRSAESIEELWTQGQNETAKRKAEGLLKLVISQGDNLVGSHTLKTISNIQCLPCLQSADKPEHYPLSLPFSSEDLLAKPREMCPVDKANIVGSAVPIINDGISPQVAKALSVGSELDQKRVLDHLENVLKSYDENDVSKYRLVIPCIFQFLSDYTHDEVVLQTLQDKECVLTESGEVFAKPKALWLQRCTSDIDLRPFRYPVPHEMQGEAEKDLLRACGAHKQQDTQLLTDVLLEIQDLHTNQTRSQRESEQDMRLVKPILDVLKLSESAVASRSVLLPVCHSEPNILQFRPAKDCTVMSTEDALGTDSFGGDEEIFIVHNEIHQDTARALGALKMKDRALTDVEDLDFGYEQREELTTRLHNLLKDSYTDGFSVPKELIQNADDAGATEVCFLLDERENEGSRQTLITDNMDSLQGPAFWAYNDATFSDGDFENIIKLGAGTKKEDASKVGRFGLGFNSVYNLTDVPSFISRHTMAIFDPHVKYLKRGAGLKLDFTRPVNRALLSRMPYQFKPYQGVFGCQLKNSSEVFYNGTLFRFPFRTPEQAADSKITKKSYGRGQRQEFLKMLLENAGSLLTFTQSVKRVKVFYLPHDCTDPSSPRCLLDLTKASQSRVVKPDAKLENQTILQYFTTHWSTNKDIKIIEDVKIDMTVTEDAKHVCEVDAHTSSTHWRLAWASGVDESAQIAARSKNEGLLPLAAVAGLLHENCIRTVQESPPGFYKSGHRFCFLPLPENNEHSSLPVHVNATFALTSSRRSLLIQTEDDLNSEGAAWNSALFADPVSRAYLLLLENVQSEAAVDTDFRRFFGLWPVSGDRCLLENFYRRLVTDENKVIPVPDEPGQWVAFSDAWFLEPDFHNSSLGGTAWNALQHFWNRNGHLVNFPASVTSALRSSGQAQNLQLKIIGELEFYTQSFFPNMENDYWEKTDRDSLILHAIKKQSPEMDDLIKNHACIPCEDSQMLRCPKETIHPNKAAAKLYIPSDGYFPQGNQAEENKGRVDFCAERVLKRLVNLGMITDDNLPQEMVLERADSVSDLVIQEGKAAYVRGRNIIEYLSSFKSLHPRLHEFHPDVVDKLSKTKFLPVLSKPADWPFPWASDGAAGTFQLAAPSDLYSDSIKDYVGSHKLVLDTSAVGISSFHASKIGVLKKLGVKTEADPGRQDMLELSTRQLKTVAQFETESDDSSNAVVQRVSKAIYSYMTKCINDTEAAGSYISSELSNKEIVWTGSSFVEPSRVAFRIRHDCRPYRFQVETSMLGFRTLLQAIGVQETFDTANLASLLEQIHIEFEGRKLPDDIVGLASRAAQSLCESSGETTELDLSQLYLPDQHGSMQLTCNLCLDDCQWLKETDSMKFVSDKIPTETAKALGVKSKRKQNFESMVKFIPFGQEEKLTDRINGLLEGYTLDSSLFKELLQNADDAGATEIRFIKDVRDLGKTKVFEGCEPLQGPALCVFNDKSFTKKDMEGIQNLGRGSKGFDALKTGQYGVGFNAVYHITDVPSFWTLEDDEKGAVCLLDPNCHYVAKDNPDRPGIKLEDVDWLQENYPDMFAGYLGTEIDMSKPGTLFRFPLRTEEMAKNSAIKQKAGTKAQVVSSDQIKELLDQFKKEMNTCLLFLNNLRKIGIYSVNPDGTLALENEVTMELCTNNTDQTEAFNNTLSQVSNNVKNEAFSLQDISVSMLCTVMKLKHSHDVEENWLTVHRCGFEDVSCLSSELKTEWNEGKFRLLPRGGVAVKVAENVKGKEHTIPSAVKHQAFCILPLPVFTSVPMHVNGHFALDHETRRNLWENKDENKSDIKTEWNEQIASQIIVPSYITALQWFKEHWFPSSEALGESELKSRLSYYHGLFPDLNLDTVATQFWVNMTKKLYRKIAEQELPTFPVLCCDQTCSLEWLPVVSSTGFAGYFNNLEGVFNKAPDKPNAEKPVVLSQGGVQQTSQSRDNSKWVSHKAQELKTLLKKINMKVLEAPYCIFQNFKKSAVNGVADISPESVAQFLKSASTRTQDSCNLADLPQPLADTSLETPAGVQILLRFIKYKPSLLENLEGLPLCLRQSGNLYFFLAGNTTDKPIVSRYFDLLSGTDNLFVSNEIMEYFLSTPDAVQAWMTGLDITTLVQLLPQTLQCMYFKTGQPCGLDQSKLPSENWLKRLWRFLESEVGVSNTPDLGDIRKMAAEKLYTLRDWNFIPAKRHTEAGEVLELYPVADMHKVVFLHEKPDRSNQNLWNTLKTQQLPFLDTTLLPSVSVLENTVASISHPLALLKALNACVGNLNPRLDQATSILSYFSNNLAGLQESCGDNSELRRMLTALPLYPSIYDQAVDISADATPLCIESTVHKEGLKEWAFKRQHRLVLLNKTSVPDNMRTFLDMETLTTAQFYYQYLLPTLRDIPHSAVLNHMHAVRRDLTSWSEDEQILTVQQLKMTSFVELNGELFLASEFYSPHISVFKVMGMVLPPKPYSDKLWESFMTTAGMISAVTESMFLRYACVIQDEGKTSLNQETTVKSDTLVRHLFHSCQNKHFSNEFLQQLKEIRFVRPSDWTQTGEGQTLCQIAQPFCGSRLVSFAESCQEQHLHLVWSSCCILHPNASPYTFPFVSADAQRNLSGYLGLQQHISKDKVIQHVITVCQNLNGNPGDMLASPYKSELVRSVMRDLYHYLQENTVDVDLTTLKKLTIVYDSSSKQMLKPENVVIDLRYEEAIKGHIQKAPIGFGEFFDFFRRLGAAERVTANHYAIVLSRLKQEAANNFLHVEEMKLIVQTAVRELFKCLKSEQANIKQLAVDHVYLPSDSERLVRSTQLAFVDDRQLRKRFEQMPQDMAFFLGFGRLEIKVLLEQNELDLLPAEHKLQFLSRIVKEFIPAEIKERATTGHHAQEAEHLLMSRELAGVVLMLALHYHKINGRTGMQVAEQTAQWVEQSLSNISVMETTNLKTMLMWKNTEVPIEGTKRAKKAFVDKSSVGIITCTVYLDKRFCEREGIKNPIVTNILKIAVQHSLGFEISGEYLKLALRNPKEARQQMEEDGIESCNFIPTEEPTVFPPPGTFIPLHLHCYLVNSFDSLYNGEHVGFEIYDPQVNEPNTNENVPVYMYAIVIEEIKQEGEVSALSRRYRIDLGPEKGTIEVSATQLYKFKRNSSQETRTTTLNHESSPAPEGASATSTETPPKLNFSEVMKEIRQVLTEAWQTLDEQGRKRVVKRLYLKWHPDKNIDNEEFCTRVVQRFQHYVNLLEQGKKLPSDDNDEENVDGSSGRRQSPNSDSSAEDFYSSFFEHMNSRSRAHRDEFESKSRSDRHPGRSSSSGHKSSRRQQRSREEDYGRFHHSSFTSSANPQPGEGRRWFRQAEADLENAREVQGTWRRGNNWVCFLCHQAAEKALKAVLYYRNANSSSLEDHDLKSIAREVRDDILERLAKKLEGRVGNHMRMRYPDVLMFPTIPADAYTSDDVRFAFDVASRVFDQVKSLIPQG